jgi:hypothetical protein|tara:strand:+ start:451 stop:657 length:207 start_codon:yes stop_codon:yes gene_type:complete
MFKLIIGTALVLSLNSPFVENSSEVKTPSFTYKNAVQMKELTSTTHCFFWLPKAELEIVKKHTSPHMH